MNSVDSHLKCVDIFHKMYKKDPTGLSFCPYRICPIGAHSDHNHGKITGLAIDKGIHIAYHPKQNGVIELASMQFTKRAQWHVSSTPGTKENDWADYLRGATIALAQNNSINIGLSGVIEGSIPIGGLSSSAAVIISFLSALCKVNGIHLSQNELIATALKAENDYVGVSCGKLDQSCEVLGKKDHLLYLDTQDDSFELIKTPASMKPYEIVIFFSGLERSLACSNFNMRVDEAKSAAYALKAFAGIEYGNFSETYLRDIPIEIYRQYKRRLPENWMKRAEHWYTEFDRVQQGAEAWRNGDIINYGKLSFDSGLSSINNWETGSPELIQLYEIMTRTEGVYGGRFSGAGFRGCCMALIDPRYEANVVENVSREFLKCFPLLKEKYASFICQSADGVKI